MDEVLKDERFSHILSDPKFRRIPKNVRKIKVDNRFQTLFKSKTFTKKCHVDEHGRSLDLEPQEDLKKLYNLDDKELSDDENVECDSKSNKPDKSSKLLKIKNQKNIKKKEKTRENNSCDEDISYINKIDKCTDIKKLNKNHSKTKSFNNVKCDDVKTSKEILKLSGKNISYDFDEEDDSESGTDSSDSDENDFDNSNQNEPENSEVSSSSEEESEDTDESEIEDDNSFDHEWEEHHEKAPDTEEITRRLALCNMDWDRIRAVDLFAVFNSFKPPDSSISSVKIYPSEFGLKRMEEEKLKGPPELVEKTLAPDEEEDLDDKKGGKYNREKLRQYQINRLKYYYAVVECDTPKTANTIYEQLNGMEYESSSVRFDLRFVPDDMEFDQEPTSVATSSSDLNEYKPRLFVTTALQQVKVGLTWDETDPHRREILQKAFTEPDNIENDIRDYLASSSSESEGEEKGDKGEDDVKTSTKERINKYKALLESLNEEEKDKNEEKFDMEITWESGAKEKAENLVKEKIEEKNLTPFEELQKKKREKQKLKKKEKKTKTIDEETSDTSMSSSEETSEETPNKKINKSHPKKTDELYLMTDAKKLNNSDKPSRKQKKKKNEQKTTDDTQIDVNDPRFSAIYSSSLFNIDPSDPHFKRTPGNLAIIAEKQRRLKNKRKSSEENLAKRSKYN